MYNTNTIYDELIIGKYISLHHPITGQTVVLLTIDEYLKMTQKDYNELTIWEH